MPEQEIAERFTGEEASQPPAVQPSFEAGLASGVHQSIDFAGVKREVILAEGMDDVVAPRIDNLGKVSFDEMSDEPVAKVRHAQLHTQYTFLSSPFRHFRESTAMGKAGTAPDEAENSANPAHRTTAMRCLVRGWLMHPIRNSPRPTSARGLPHRFK